MGPKEMVGSDGDLLKGGQGKAAAKDGYDEAEAAETELTGSDSDPEAATPGETAGGTGEEASLG